MVVLLLLRVVPAALGGVAPVLVLAILLLVLVCLRIRKQRQKRELEVVVSTNIRLPNVATAGQVYDGPDGSWRDDKSFSSDNSDREVGGSSYLYI